ncbi:MAG: NFACT family protein [Candidatus Micrarchaeia archaeon]
MRMITNQELALLSNELNDEFKNSFIEKFYEITDNTFLMKVSKEHKKFLIQILLCHSVNKTNYILNKNSTPTNFALAVRKRIEGFRIDSITQYNKDRILLIKINKHDLKLNIIIEMFGKGNFIILDESFKIMLAYDYHIFKDRSIKVGVEYKPPQQSNNNNENNEINEMLKLKNKYFIYKDENNKVVDYSIDINPKYSNLKSEEVNSLQEALDLFYHDNIIIKKEKSETDKKIEELQLSIKKQEALIEKFSKEREKDIEIGNTIMNNMYLINQIINELKVNKKIDKEELNRKYKDDNVKILNINLKDNIVIIEIKG